MENWESGLIHLFAKQATPSGVQWFESTILLHMKINTKDILSVINICLASVEKQRNGPNGEVMRPYLDGYEAACRMILEHIEAMK